MVKDLPGGDSPLERLLGVLMLAGVACSAGLLLLGLGWFMAGARAEPLRTTGLTILMITPALRVAIAVVEALRLRDWLFVTTTIAVVVLLGLTLVFALDRLGERSRQPSAASTPGGRPLWVIDSPASRSR